MQILENEEYFEKNPPMKTDDVDFTNILSKIPAEKISEMAEELSMQYQICYVDEIIPEGKLKKKYYDALSRKHPFSNFNHIVHNCKYREEWFKFRQKALEEYVRKHIERYRPF